MADTAPNRKLVSALLAEIARTEQACKYAKSNLRALPDFNAIQIFRLLTDTEVVNLLHLAAFIRGFEVQITDDQLDLLMSRLDKDGDGVLSWSEFLTSCIDTDYSPDNTHFVNSWREATSPPEEVQNLFLEVLIAEFEAAVSLNSARQDLNQRIGANEWRAIFEYMDKEYKAHITLVNLWNFMKFVYPSTALGDAELVFKYLDTNSDGIIDFSEWMSLSESNQIHQSERDTQEPQTLASANQSKNGFNGLKTIPGPNGIYHDSSRFQSHNSWRGSGQKEGSKGLTMRSTAEKTWNGSGNLNSTAKSPQKEYGSLFSSNQNTDRVKGIEPSPHKATDRVDHPIIVEERFDSRDQSSRGSYQKQSQNKDSVSRPLKEEIRPSISRPIQAKSELLIEDGSKPAVRHEQPKPQKPPRALPAFKSEIAQGNAERSLSRRSKASSSRYLKPGQESVFSERSSATVRSRVLQNSLQNKLEDLKKKRESDKLTLERDATRGVMGSAANEDDIFAQKELTLVPRRDQPMGHELYHESERKTAYEDAVYQASEMKYNIPQYNQASVEKNSYSRFDTSEGRKYSSHRNIEYISTVDSHNMKQRDELVEFYVRLLQDFRIIEQKRLNLSMRFDLKLDELFQNVDISESNYLSVSDLIHFFKEIQLDASEEEAVLLLTRFDRNRDRFLDFDEFSQIFLPFNGKFREALLSKSSRQRGSIHLYERNTLKALRDCLASILDAEKNFEYYKQAYQGRLHELFDLVDFQHTGRLVLEDFKQVFGAHEFAATDMEISALIYRFDLNMNGEITPDEFFSVLKESPDTYSEDFLSQRGVAPNDLVFKSGKKVVTTTTKKTDYCTCVCRCYTTICRGCCSCETIEEVHYSTTPCRTSVRTITETEETFAGGPGKEVADPLYTSKKLFTPKYNFDDGTETTVRTEIRSAPRTVTTSYVFDEPDSRYRLPARRHKFGDYRFECGA